MWPEVTVQSCKHCGASSPIYCECDPLSEPQETVKQPIKQIIQRENQWHIERQQAREQIRLNRLAREREVPLRYSQSYIRISVRQGKERPGWGQRLKSLQELRAAGLETWGDVDEFRILLAAIVFRERPGLFVAWVLTRKVELI